ncbi:hypothetical protein FOZ62_006819, partial [Perkinsus olseni]
PSLASAMPAVRGLLRRPAAAAGAGDAASFMEVVFENMRDLGEPDVEIMRVNRILEENYFDTVESFAATTPDIWDALCLPRHVMEAVRKEIGIDDDDRGNGRGGADKALAEWQSEAPTPAAAEESDKPAITKEEWERRRQEAARRGEKRTGEGGAPAEIGPGFDPGTQQKPIESVEVVPYTLKQLGDPHVSWVAVLQEAVQRLTNRNTAPGVGLFNWEYESRMVGSSGERLEHRATVSFRLDA